MAFLLFLFLLFCAFVISGWAGFFLVLTPVLTFVIYDYIKYPNKFRGRCKSCGRSHGRFQYWNKSLGEKFSHENGYIFLSIDCLKKWEKENYFCSYCKAVDEYLESTITHKFKRIKPYLKI